MIRTAAKRGSHILYSNPFLNTGHSSNDGSNSIFHNWTRTVEHGRRLIEANCRAEEREELATRGVLKQHHNLRSLREKAQSLLIQRAQIDLTRMQAAQ